MLNQERLQQIRNLAHSVSQREGCELYDLEFIGAGANRVLRIFIDRSDAPVSVEDCTRVSRGVNEVLDQQEDLIAGGAYQLEVSSPGLERKLREVWHFERVIGRQIQVNLFAPLGQKHPDVSEKAAKLRSFQGELVGNDNEQIVLKWNAEELKIKFDEMSKAQVLFAFQNENLQKGK